MTKQDSGKITPDNAAAPFTNNATPLYIQLEQKLLNAIKSGIFPSGSKMPTENEFSNTYHVSRVTVRKSLKLLEDEGYIERKVGKGTYVTEKKLQRDISGNVRSFTLMCKETGMKASAKMVRMELKEPDEKQRKLMNLDSDQNILLIERVRYADEHAVMIERDIFSDEFSFLFNENLEINSLYELVRQNKSISFTHADRTIDIVFSNASEAKLLGIKAGYPLLRIYSITESENNEYVTLSEQLCIGDKFKLKV